MAGSLSSTKKGGQKYQNTVAFYHNKGSTKTKNILDSPVTGLCAHCTDVILWRKKFRKYKPLTQPGKCIECHQRTIKSAYHVLCQGCATKKGVCAKCRNQGETLEILSEKTRLAEEAALEKSVESALSVMTERMRRSCRRKLDRGQIEPEQVVKMGKNAAALKDDMWDFSDDEDEDDGDEDEEDGDGSADEEDSDDE
ncbi:hypothetical protein GQ42DRAFT_165125 [Ramicandelaber brevisporus]|nr:hypothetical protein GQ42DRAFT_165125 [Ramicandelaber brevisporus]